MRWSKALHVAELAFAKLGKPMGKKVALFGPAFKPNTDDVREASSLKIAKALLEAEAHVSAVDPDVKTISLA